MGTVCVPNAYMCGWDWEHNAAPLWMVYIPLTDHSPWTKICWFFVRTQKKLCTLRRWVFMFTNCTLVICIFCIFLNMDRSIIRLPFIENWFTAHLVWIVCEPSLWSKCACEYQTLKNKPVDLWTQGDLWFNSPSKHQRKEQLRS